MNNIKKILAICGVVLVLLAFCLPMGVAIFGDGSGQAFLASLFAAFFVSFMVFVILMVAGLLKKRQKETGNALVTSLIFDMDPVLAEEKDGKIYPADYAAAWTAYLKRQGYRLLLTGDGSEEAFRLSEAHLEFLNNIGGAAFDWQSDHSEDKTPLESLLKNYSITAAKTICISARDGVLDEAESLGMKFIRFTGFKEIANILEQTYNVK